MVFSIPNETANKVAYVASQSNPATPAMPTARLLGDLAITKTADLSRTEEMTGGYDRLVTPKKQMATYAGTYSESLTFETLPMHMRWGLKGGGAGVTDGETVPGYTYSKSPSFGADDIDAFTAMYGVPGLGYRSYGLMHNEFTITVDADNTDDAWQLSSTLYARDKTPLPGMVEGVATGGSTTTLIDTTKTWTVNQWEGAYLFLAADSHTGLVRQVLSNTATTLTLDGAVPVAVAAGEVYRLEGLFPDGIGIPRYDVIPVLGTKLYLDPYDAMSSALGTTQVRDRLISFNLTVATNRTAKKFVENVDGYSSRTGRGGRIISGQIRLENDRRDEELEWERLKEIAIRIEQTGDIIDPDEETTKLARIDIARALWETPTEDERENNMTVTYGFLAYLPENDPILNVTAINTLATLP